MNSALIRKITCLIFILTSFFYSLAQEKTEQASSIISPLVLNDLEQSIILPSDILTLLNDAESSRIWLYMGGQREERKAAMQVLSQKMKMPVLEVKLFQFMKTYIGETEKNLESLFIKAKKSGHILFFDEADALFGKRTVSPNDASDRLKRKLIQLSQSMAVPISISLARHYPITPVWKKDFDKIIAFPTTKK